MIDAIREVEGDRTCCVLIGDDMLSKSTARWWSIFETRCQGAVLEAVL